MPKLVIVSDTKSFRQLLREVLAEVLPASAGQPAAAPDTLLTMAQVCEEFGISKTTLSDWKKRGVVPFVRLGRRVYFERDKVLEAGRAHTRYQRKDATESNVGPRRG